MKTLILKINPKRPERKLIKIASDIIKKGGLVAFPTETVYGLGANTLSKNAVKRIFKAKGRPSDNPLIVHIAYKKDINKLAKNIPKIANKLINEFWPGPLTLVLQKKSIIPNNVTSGLKTVAIRMPQNKIALSLIKLAGPIAAPSANISKKPSSTMGKHVIKDFNGKIECIIDGGNANIGLESTVIDLTTNPRRILRPGGITFEQLKKIIPNLTLSNSIRGEVRSPGMKYRHYMPKAKVILVEKDNKLSREKIRILSKGKKVYEVKIINKRDFAKSLFKIFRECNEKDVEIIIVHAVNEKGLGKAIMNRVRKASSYII